jgi:hypothetical protein
VGALHPPRSEAISDETASLASTATTGSADSVNTVATGDSLNTNVSVCTSASVDTTHDLDFSGGRSNSAVRTLPTVPTGSWEDEWYNVDMDAVADYIPRKPRETINTRTFTAKNNLNKYGQTYDRTLPNLTDYRNRSVAKKGYDPKVYYTRTQAEQFHDRKDYIPIYDNFKAMKINDEYQRGVGRRRKSKADFDTTARHAAKMLTWRQENSKYDRNSDDHIKIKKALERAAKHPR